MSAMKYGRSLERLIREVIIANPALGPMHVLKDNVNDGFYLIGLRPTDFTNLRLVFPSEGEDAKPRYGVETHATHILHGNGDSGGSIKYSLAMQYPRFTA